ncbi:hypothetical protein PSV3_00252 [Septimatrevirus PSV33]|uniref:Uncharacterized protein n=1 Tax=Pseudomonas phage PSV3 TaxID=3003632 RepID=A0AAE9VWE3_9CAUD|nr:hypothetical protein PM406_gp53 [Pseudomonas phage PSV3]WBF76954.1 hypothetical protein PSV3_00252 [Pseudomonas phage PSV3]
MPAAAPRGLLLGGLLGRLAAPCCALRLLGRFLHGLLLAAPSGTACGLLRGLLLRLTAPSPAVLALRLLRLLSEACAALRLLLLRLRCRCACASLARFVAVHIEDLFNFGILRVVFLRPDFDKKRQVVKLRRIGDLEHADYVADCRKLAMRDFDGLLVGMVQVQAISAGRALLRAVDNPQVQLQITAVVRLVGLDFGRFDDYRMLANRQASDALGRVVLLGVERLDKLHDVSPFRKVFAIGYGGEVNRFTHRRLGSGRTVGR